MATIRLNQTDNNRNQICKQGDIVLIELPENPTTGHTWQIIQTEGLSLKDDSYESDPEKNLVGAGGKRTFVFVYNGLRRGFVKLANFQPWEGQESTSDHFSVQLESE